jgi:hypothetical protein
LCRQVEKQKDFQNKTITIQNVQKLLSHKKEKETNQETKPSTTTKSRISESHKMRTNIYIYIYITIDYYVYLVKFCILKIRRFYRYSARRGSSDCRRHRPQVLIKAVIAELSEGQARNLSSQLVITGRDRGGYLTNFDCVLAGLLGSALGSGGSDKMQIQQQLHLHYLNLLLVWLVILTVKQIEV